MSSCYCSLAGTAACRNCSNNPYADFPPTVRTNTITVTDRTFYTQSLPSVHPERKKGRWYDIGSLSCRCSECGCKSQKESLFCPNCGAKMKVEETNGE